MKFHEAIFPYSLRFSYNFSLGISLIQANYFTNTLSLIQKKPLFFSKGFGIFLKGLMMTSSCMIEKITSAMRFARCLKKQILQILGIFSGS